MQPYIKMKDSSDSNELLLAPKKLTVGCFKQETNFALYQRYFREIKHFPQDLSPWVHAITMNDTGQFIIACNQSIIRAYDRLSGQLVGEFMGHTGVITGLAALTDQYIASCSKDKTVQIWNLVKPEEPAIIHKLESAVTAMVITQAGLIALGCANGSLHLIDRAGNHYGQQVIMTQGAITKLELASNGNLVSGSEKGLLCTWSPDNVELLTFTYAHNQEITELMPLSAQTVVTGSYDGRLAMWDLESKTKRFIISDHSNWITALHYSMDDKILCGYRSGMMRVIDPCSGKIELEVQAAEQAITGLITLENGQIVSSSLDSKLHIWQPQTGHKVDTIVQHEDFIIALGVTQAGRVITSSLDGTIKLTRITGTNHTQECAMQSKQKKCVLM